MTLLTEIAIVGMSCRFPGANSIGEFWNNLINGIDSVTSLPDERWYMKDNKNLKAGYLQCALDEFDYNFFHMSPKEAGLIDPQQRLFLEVSWESLEDASIPPCSLSGRSVGVFLGISSDDYWRHHVNSADGKMHALMGNCYSGAPGRLSHFLNLRGPTLAIDSTCASSAVAVHMAVESLRSSECDLALAGGVSLILNTDTIFPDTLLSERSRSFSADASGFAPAEGCGIIVLKRLSEAIAHQNKIIGVIRATGVNHTGRSTSFGTPVVDAEQSIMSTTLKKSRLEPNEIRYVEAHAGGTYVGDPIEFDAIARVYSTEKRHQPLLIGSFKSAIGHTLAAAGIAGIIKTLLCFKHRLIPPQLHLNVLHPNIDLSRIPAVIPTVQVPVTCAKFCAAVNCFGITGTNVSIIIEAPPTPSKSVVPNKISTHILTISAKDEVSLAKLCSMYEHALATEILKRTTIEDFTYSANCGRSHLSQRIAIVGSSLEDMRKKLCSTQYCLGSIANTSKNSSIVFLFAGQGCQYFGMGRELYETNLYFKNAMDQCNVIFEHELGISLFSFLWEEGHDMSRTKFSQPAIYCIEICLFRFCTALGLNLDIVLGHSVGEFAAAVAAGALTLEDGLRLICYRSKLIDSLPEAKMLVVGASANKTQELVTLFLESTAKLSVHNATEDNWIEIACENSTEQTVVSTTVEIGQKFQKFLVQNEPDIKVTMLESKHAFHSRSMDIMLDEYEKYAEDIMKPYYDQPLKCRYISAVTGSDVFGQEIDGSYWRKHCRQPVLFSTAVEQLHITTDASPIFVELSPRPTLLSFVLGLAKDVQIVGFPTLRKGQDPWVTITNTLSSVYVNVNANWDFSLISKGNYIQLPSYAWNKKYCWTSPRTQKTSYNEYLKYPNTSSASQFLTSKKVPIDFDKTKVTMKANDLWLIFGSNETPLGIKLAEKLKQNSQKVTFVEQGLNFGRHMNSWIVNPLQLATFQALAHIFLGREVAGVIYLWGIDNVNDYDVQNPSDFQKTHKIKAVGLLHIMQMMITCSWNSKLVLITQGAFGGNPSQGSLLGLHKSFTSTFPQCQSTAIDIDVENSLEISVNQILYVMNHMQQHVQQETSFKGEQAFATNLMNFELTSQSLNNNTENLNCFDCSKNIGFKNVDNKFRCDGTYLVTNGSTLLGFELGMLICGLGGEVLLLCATELNNEQVSKSKPYKDLVKFLVMDIQNFDSLKTVVDNVKPPIRAVFHIPDVSKWLQNNDILDQNTRNLDAKFQACLYPAYNLHLLTSHLLLEYFVTVSFCATTNGYLNCLANYRVEKLSKPSLNINVDISTNNEYYDVEQMWTKNIVSCVESALRYGVNGTVTVNPNYVTQLGESHETQTLPLHVGHNHVTNTQSRVERLAAEVQSNENSKKLEILEELLEAIFKQQTANLEELCLDRSKPFIEMGLDSLLSMELRMRIRKLLNVTLYPTALLEHNCIRSLAIYLNHELQLRSQTSRIEDHGDVNTVATPLNNQTTNSKYNFQIFKKLPKSFKIFRRRNRDKYDF